MKQHLPELPDEKRARFIKDFGLSAYDATVLVAEKERADFFEQVAKGRDHSRRRRPTGKPSPKKAARSASSTGTYSRTARIQASLAPIVDEAALDLAARALGDVARAIAGDAGEAHRGLGRGRERVPFLAEQMIEPALGDHRRDHVMQARVGGHARAEAAERRPEARIARGPGALEDPAAELALARGRDALERGREVEEIALGLELPAFGLLEARRGGGEERIEHVADRASARPRRGRRRACARRSRTAASPRISCGKSTRSAKSGARSRDAMLVAGRAEAGPPAVAGEEPEDALVIGRSAPRLGLGGERVEEVARDLRASTRRARRGGARARAADP